MKDHPMLPKELKKLPYLVKNGRMIPKYAGLYEKRYPLTFRLLTKEKLTRQEICAIFSLVLEMLLKRFEVCRFSEEKLTETLKEIPKHLPLKIDDKCPICRSPFRWQYELYYLSCGKNLEWVLAASRFWGESHITHKHLKNHFQKHFSTQLDISQSSQKSLERITLKEGPDIVENVLTHFFFTDELLENLERKIQRIVEEGGEIPSKDLALLKSLLITFLRYASWLRNFPKKKDEVVDNLGRLFPLEI